MPRAARGLTTVGRRSQSVEAGAGTEDDRAAPGAEQEVRTYVGALVRAAVLPVGSLLLLLWSLICLVPASALPGAIGATAVAASAALVLLVTVIAVPVITMAVRGRRWVSLGVVSVAALLPWVFLAPYAAGDQPTGPRGEDLRVMVVNAQEGRASAEDIVAAVRSNAITVLVVTELTGELSHDLTTIGLDRQLTARWVRLPGQSGVSTDPEAGMGIWSAPSGPGAAEVTSTDVPGTTWPAVSLRLTDPEVTVIAGHVARPIPAAGDRWAGDLRAMREAMATAPGPRILLGNLNATPWHADLRAFSADSVRDAADVLGRGPRPTWPTWSPVSILPVDHILVGPRVGVASVGTVVIDGSDHRGLLAALRLPQA